MKKNILYRFRSTLSAHRNNLLEWFGTSSMKTKTQVCDCTTEKCESISGENMPIINEIEKTLLQIDKGDFGKCCLCDGEVETHRLELDYKTNVCLEHFTELELRELEHDLEIASKVQQHLLPHTLPAIDGIQMSVLSKPARIVGGDYYDFFCFRDSLQGVAIADVMGKGLPASMLMSNLQASLRILGPETENLHDTAFRLNQLFRYNLKLIRFITLFLAAVDTKEQALHYCNAGHNPPLLWNESSKTVQLLNPTGPAIGIIPEPQFTSETIQFHCGDILLLYTDGLLEARNKNGEEFGDKRIHKFIKSYHGGSANNFLNGLRNELEQWTEVIEDDLTIMVIKNNRL